MKFYQYFILFILSFTYNSFSQSISNPNVVTNVEEAPNNVDNAVEQTDDVLASLQNQETQTKPTTTNGTIAEGNLIQYDKEMWISKEDPYPLEMYKGEYLTHIDDIKKAYQSKNIEQVKASLEQMYMVNTADFPPDGYLMLSAIYDQLQDYKHSLEILEDGLTKVPENMKDIFYLNKSQILRHSGKNQEAIEILNNFSPEVIKQYPEIFFYRGLSYLYLNSNDLSILNLRRYLEVQPKGAQNVRIRRAIAWLILNKAGKIDSGNTAGSGREQDLEKMLQLLMEKQMADQVGDLIKSTVSNLDDKALEIQEKELEDMADYSDIAE